MTQIIKKTGGSVDEHVWAEGGEAVEVPEDLAIELVELAPNEFSIATDEKPRRGGRNVRRTLTGGKAEPEGEEEAPGDGPEDEA